jgi:hypothetical protein
VRILIFIFDFWKQKYLGLGDFVFHSPPLHALTFCFRTFLKHPRLITTNDAIEKVCLGLTGWWSLHKLWHCSPFAPLWDCVEQT